MCSFGNFVQGLGSGRGLVIFRQLAADELFEFCDEEL